MSAPQEIPAYRTVFSLRSLIEFVTVCAIICGLTNFVGVASGFALFVLAFAIWTRQGAIAMSILCIALLLADYPQTENPYFPPVGKAMCVALVAAGLCVWGLRRRLAP